MRGHWISGTRKLNRHYQSGGESGLVLFDVPETNPVYGMTVNCPKIGNNYVYQSSGTWGNSIKRLKLQPRRYRVRWDITPVSTRFKGIGVISSVGAWNSAPDVSFPTADIVYYSGDSSHPVDYEQDVRQLSNNPTISYMAPYYSFTDWIWGTFYYTENDSDNLTSGNVIIDLTGATAYTLSRRDILAVSFVGDFNSSSGSIQDFYGKMWLEPI